MHFFLARGHFFGCIHPIDALFSGEGSYFWLHSHDWRAFFRRGIVSLAAFPILTQPKFFSHKKTAQDQNPGQFSCKHYFLKL
ncbi:hypothetical protein CYJ36_15040 [Bacillus sp. UMB0893]|nr:hypothetical protein CYJ36_15040 [Bacillus sp. UMB0893]